jgi:hypothetical protein
MMRLESKTVLAKLSAATPFEYLGHIVSDGNVRY